MSGTSSGATNLLVEYLSTFGKDTADSKRKKFSDRLKLVSHCRNLEEFGLPSFITAYNGKPVLLRSTIELVSGEGYNEIDVNIHKFGSLPKQALQILYSR
jgi:hypothetical protein